MKKHHAVRSLVVYVGFLDGKPDVIHNGPRRIEVMLSKAAGKWMYEDVRTARLVFDADWDFRRRP